MRLAVIQMSPGADKAANIAQAAGLLEACVAAERPALIVLPEMWSCLGGDRATKRAMAEILPEGDGPAGAAYGFLRDAARRHGVTIHGGSIGEIDPGAPEGPIYNTSVVFGPDGDERGRYRKLHLFDVTAPDGQGYRESALYGAGDRVVTCQAAGVTLGLAICYDLRFGELFGALRAAGAELIALPSAFTVQTGRDHWEPLLRARAIETQCWVAAAATWGRHVDIGQDGPIERQTYGRSLICDPWGQVVACAADGVGWAAARMDGALTARLRANMPVQAHRAATAARLARTPGREQRGA